MSISFDGRASSASVLPASAASCIRRDTAMSSREPSVITTANAEDRSARSIAHRREAPSDGSMKIETQIANLLDNITKGNRDLVEQRLVALREQRQSLAIRAEQLDGLASAESQVVDMANEIA